MNADLDLAWAAGLFEGEGCISISRAGDKSYPFLCLGMTDRPIVERFARVMGCGNFYADNSRQREQKGWSQCYTWQLNGIEKVMAAMERLGPWLGERRLAQWDRAFAAYQESHPVVIRHCLDCDVAFNARSEKQAKFCSHECGERFRNEQRKRRYALARAGGKSVATARASRREGGL